MATSELRTGQKLKNSLFFSLFAGNLGVETGSTWTASATTQSRILRDFPKPRKLRRIGGVARQRSVSEIGYPKFGGDFGAFVSGREIPFPGNRDSRE
jgi:hypothetical protein